MMSYNDANFSVSQAILNTTNEYFSATVKQRSRMAQEQAGSSIPLSSRLLKDALYCADWMPYHHPAIKDEARGFMTKDIGGTVGVVPLSSLDFASGSGVVFDDTKDTGMVSLLAPTSVVYANRQERDYTVIILGMDAKGKEIVYTFHPGDPVPPSTVSIEDLKAFGVEAYKLGCACDDVSALLTMGFHNAKVISN